MEALQRLGELIPQKAQIVIAGGAALILGDYIQRGTGDGDVVYSDPPLTHRMGTFGNLRVLLLGRMDLILSKFFG